MGWMLDIVNIAYGTYAGGVEYCLPDGCWK